MRRARSVASTGPRPRQEHRRWVPPNLTPGRTESSSHREKPSRRSGIATANPSGKFWMPMPIASAIAPANVAAGNPAATAPNATPTASPSGKLCRVMAVTSSTLRCQVVLIPSACSISSPRCRCGKMRSTTHRNAPPSRNPTVAGIQPGTPAPLRHLDGRRQQRPKTGRDHHAGRKAEHGIQQRAAHVPGQKNGRRACRSHTPGKNSGEKCLDDGIERRKCGHLNTSER